MEDAMPDSKQALLDLIDYLSGARGVPAWGEGWSLLLWEYSSDLGYYTNAPTDEKVPICLCDLITMQRLYRKCGGWWKNSTVFVTASQWESHGN